MIKSTDDNLRSKVATEPLTRWLISAAKQQTTLTYKEVKHRLEKKCKFDTIFSSRIGRIIGPVMDKILERKPSAPLLNVLLVRGDTRQPGGGAREYLAEHFPEEKWLREKDAHKNYPDRWKRIVKQATKEVYAFPHWEDLYKRVSGKSYEHDPVIIEGKERDGLRWGRKGEGENHKALRLWVKDNPDRIKKKFHGVRTETEVELLSGDRVDVVYYAKTETVAIEVKSRDSNRDDLKRGIYQCVKYRAVLRAQDLQQTFPVYSLLVTESKLDPDLEHLAKKLGVKHQVVSPKLEATRGTG